MWFIWSKDDVGGEHHRCYKHTKFHQNPRVDPKFLVDLTQNDPYSGHNGTTVSIIGEIFVALHVKKYNRLF